MKDSKIKTANCTSKILFWMLIFFIFYIPLLALVLSSLAACIWGIIWALGLISNDEVLLSIILIVVFLALIIFLIFPILKATFKPFFTLYKGGQDERIEITESDEPELVKFVNTLADKTRNKHPKHIYVSSAANACVFFNSRFINIFLPVRKNIEIGLSLFQGMTKSEIAACISHEFGHFAQSNMRWGSVIHILNSLIKNVMGINNKWNSVVNQLINCPWIIGVEIVFSIGIKAVGWILYGLTIGYISLMEFIYEKIQISYLELSRKMEYKADLVAAKTVGSKNVISFMYKLIELSERVDVFQRMLLRLAQQNKTITDYWASYHIADSYLSNLTHKKMSSSNITINPLSPIADRKLIIDNIYSTHPDWQSRINEIKESNFPQIIEMEGDAESLISTNLWNKVGRLTLNDLYKKIEPTIKTKTIKDDELKNSIENELYWYQYMPFFQRDILEFDIEDCEPNNNVFSPDNKNDLITISSFEAAKSDWINANAVINGQLKIKHLIYDELRYNRSNLPIDEIQNQYNQLLQQARSIDKKICQKALAGTDNVEHVKSAYSYIFYAQKILDDFSTTITPNLNNAIDVLNKSASNANQHQFKQLQNSLDQLRKELYDFTHEKMNLYLFNKFAPQNAIICLNEFRNHQGMFIGDSISADSINLVISTCQWIKEVHETIIYRSKMFIINACLAKEQQDYTAFSEDENAFDNDMVPCPSCGEMLKIGDSVCHKCNTAIVWDDDLEELVPCIESNEIVCEENDSNIIADCPYCGHPIKIGDESCSMCGMALEWSTAMTRGL